jgi:hypothetical protein
LSVAKATEAITPSRRTEVMYFFVIIISPFFPPAPKSMSAGGNMY